MQCMQSMLVPWPGLASALALQVPARRRGAFNGNSPITVGDQRGRRSGKLA